MIAESLSSRNAAPPLFHGVEVTSDTLTGRGGLALFSLGTRRVTKGSRPSSIPSRGAFGQRDGGPRFLAAVEASGSDPDVEFTAEELIVKSLGTRSGVLWPTWV